MKKVFLLILIGFVLILNSVNAQDLVGYWKFNEGSGDTAYDTSGYSNDGTLYGSLNPQGWTTDCIISGSCLKFNGQDDYVRINNFGDFSNGFTITFWFNMSDRVNMQRPISSIFFTTCYVSDLAPYSMQCFVGDGTAFPDSQSTSGWNYGVWTHFAMTYDTATGDWIIYRNGNPVGTDSSSVVMDMTNYFCIGANCWATGSEDNFNGTIDEVKIYNRSLSSSEIMADYTGTGTSSSSTTSTTTTPPGQVTISGQLSNSSGIVEALVTLFNPGTSQVNNSESTVAGVYSMNIWPGVYDLQYNIYRIPNFFIKLLSLTITSNLEDIVDNVNSLSNGISFTVDVSDDQEIQVYSNQEPISVKANGVELSKPTTLPLSENEWTYSSGEIKMIVSPATITTSTTTTTTTSTTLTIESTTTIYIPAEADYIVTGSDSNYEAIRVSDGLIISSGSNAATVINDVLNEMASGQRVDFIGDFTIDSSVTVNKDNLYFDFSQATVNIANNILRAFLVNGDYNTFYGGQYDPFTNTGTHSIWTGGSSAIHYYGAGGLVDGFEFTGFPNIAPLVPASGGLATIIQNCYFHNNNGGHIVLNNRGNNIITHCKLGTGATGIMVNEGVPNNTIENCEFVEFGSNAGTHAIYISGDNAGVKGGNNEIKDCKFHDGVVGAAILLKSKENNVHNNEIYNLIGEYTVPFSIYSEHTGWTANNNKIYNNTVTNCYWGFRIIGGNKDSQGNCIGEETNDNEIYSNTFDNIQHVFLLQQSIQCEWVRRTKIYYNTFISCGELFHDTTHSPPNMVEDLIIAYNDFSQTTITDESFKTDYQNTMVYGNVGLEDFNVPDPLPIPPPS